MTPLLAELEGLVVGETAGPGCKRLRGIIFVELSPSATEVSWTISRASSVLGTMA